MDELRVMFSGAEHYSTSGSVNLLTTGLSIRHHGLGEPKITLRPITRKGHASAGCSVSVSGTRAAVAAMCEALQAGQKQAECCRLAAALTTVLGDPAHPYRAAAQDALTALAGTVTPPQAAQLVEVIKKAAAQPIGIDAALLWRDLGEWLAPLPTSDRDALGAAINLLFD